MLKVLAVILIVALLIPPTYLIWRAGQPMSMPEYDGRTYYQLLSERQKAFAELAAAYQTNHPGAKVKPDVCFRSEVAISAIVALPWAGLCAASEFIPALRIYGPKTKQMGCGQIGATWTNFPSAWWNTYEKLLYEDILSTAPQTPVPYCRIPVP